MNKINNFLKQHIIKIISCFVICQPILDLLTSIQLHSHMSLTIGVIVRFLFLVSIIYYSLFLSGSKRKWYLIYLVLIGVYLGFFSYNIFIHTDLSVLMINLKETFKSLYLPLILPGLYYIYKDNRTTLKDINIIWVFIIYITIILLADITNTAFLSYAHSKTGHVGWFNSANEIGALIAIFLPFVFDYVFRKIGIIRLLILGLGIYAVITIGTKIPLLSLLLCSLIYIFRGFVKIIKTKNKKLITLSISAILILGVTGTILIPKTPIYKNTIIHLNYLKMDSVMDVIKKPNLIDHFVFGERLSFLQDTYHVYHHSDLSSKLLGIGYTSSQKMIEMDIFDIFLRHGLIGTLIYFYGIIYIIFTNKSRCKIKYMLSISLIIFISLLAGHVLIAPAVSIFVALILIKYLMEQNNKKDLLITSYNLDIGGIETSLITLLKYINAKDYNITLVLEQKKGIFLSEVPPVIRVKEYIASTDNHFLKRKIINMLLRLKWFMTSYHQYDTSVCFAPYSLPGVYLTHIASDNDIMFIHSNYLNVYKHDKTLIDQFFKVRRLNSFRKVVFVSNESKNDLVKLYPWLSKKSVVINNLIDYERIIEGSKRPINMKKSENMQLVFVGRLEEQSKCLTRLINVIEKVNQKTVKVELLMIGDGPDKNLYTDMIKEHHLESQIKMLGALKNPYPYMKQADYLILTSNYEGFPVIYNEAVVLNKPIITTVDVSDDFITIPHRFGVVVDQNENDIVNIINHLITHPLVISEVVDVEALNHKRLLELDEIFKGVK